MIRKRKGVFDQIVLIGCAVILFSLQSVNAIPINSTIAPTIETTNSSVSGDNNENEIIPIEAPANVERNLTRGQAESNSTNMNYVIEYKPLVFDNPEDIKTQQEWGGNCTLANWDNCKVLDTWFGKYEDPKDEEIKEFLIDCKEEPVVCLKNSWTVTRCNLLCMSRCNREIQYKYDKYVSHSGECQAHSHG